MGRKAKMNEWKRKKNNRKVNKKKENHGLKGKKIINENEIKKKSEWKG